MADESHNQQMLMQQQQTSQQQQVQQQQQAVAATMSLANPMDPGNQMNVSTPINVTTINVSQPQTMSNVQATVNTSSGNPVQMGVPQLAAQSQAPPPGTMMSMSQSTAPHPTMIHPTMTMAQSPLQQVQVIQQPLSAYNLQQLYPQQQMFLPGNLTLQHAGMTTPTLQSLGATQSLSLQLQAKATLDPKNSVGGQTLQAVNAANKGMAGTMMTASGQVIATAGGKPNYHQQMMTAGPGKQIIHSQQGFAPANANQTVVIGQLGVIPNQQSIFNHKALAESQKGKTYMMNQQATLQPKSPIYSSSLPVHSSAQVFNGSHIKQITSQPQLLTSQAPGTMFSQAQILGSLALGTSLPHHLQWTSSGCLQQSAFQNPIIIQSPPSIHLPVAAATAPVPASSYSAQLAPQKAKQVRVRQGSSVATQTVVSSAATINTNLPPIRAPQIKPKMRTVGHPLAPSMMPHMMPQMATTQTQTNQSHAQHTMLPPQMPMMQHQLSSSPTPHHKSDAANQTKPTPEMKSIATQSKSVAVEAKQSHLPFAKTQAMVAPSAKMQTSVPIGATMPSPIAPAISTVAPMPNSYVTVTVASVAPSTNSVSSSTSMPSMPSLPFTGHVNTEQLKPHFPERKDCSVSTQEMVHVEQENKVDVVKPELIVKPTPPVVKDKQPQKAIVKPHKVLTHVIDGFIVQEGPEPFPVSRSSLMNETMLSKSSPPESPEKKPNPNIISNEKKRKVHRPRGNVELAKCEFCKKMGPKSKFKRSKRFCSTSCAKRFNVCCSKRVGLIPPAAQEPVVATGKGKKKVGFKTRKGWRKQEGGRLAYNTSEYNEDENQEDSNIQMEEENAQGDESAQSLKPEEEATESPSGSDSPILNTAPSLKDEEMEVEKLEPTFATKLPNKWTVQEVFDFIRDLPGCSDYADEFRSQEIDGQALLLLKEDHLMTAMCMKLGPALKLISRINSIKEELSHS